MSQVFGLGLVLNFTDNATAGLNAASQAFAGFSQSLNNGGATADKIMGMANSVSTFGAGLMKSVTIPFGAAATTLAKFGMNRATFVEQNQLAWQSLMGSAEKASEYMDSLMAFAKQTPFRYETIASGAQSLVAYGVAADKAVPIMRAVGDAMGGMGKSQEDMLSVIDTLSKINVEGKASGTRLNQLAAQGIDAAKIIGNLKGFKDYEEAMKSVKKMDTTEFIDLLTEGLKNGTDGALGMTGAFDGMMNKMKGTWAGALDSFKSALTNAGQELMGKYIDENGFTQYRNLKLMTEALNSMGSAIKLLGPVFQPTVDAVFSGMGRASTAVSDFVIKLMNLINISQKWRDAMKTGDWSPFSTALEGVNEKFRGVIDSFLETNDRMKGLPAKLMSMIPAFLGITAAAGPVLFVLGKIGAMPIVAKTLGGVFDILTGKTIRLGNAFSLSGTGLLTFGSLAIVAYQAWKNNFMGIQDKLASTTQKFELFWSYLTKGDLTEAQWNLADSLGLRSTIELLGQIKYYMGFVKEGFGEGFNQFFTDLFGAFEKIAPIMRKIIDAIAPLKTLFKNLFGEGLEDNYKGIGNIIGRIAGFAVVLLPLLKLVRGFKSVGGLLGGLLGAGKEKGGSSKSQGLNPKETLKTLSSVAMIIGGITLIAVALGALTKIPGFTDLLGGGIGTIMSLTGAILPMVAAGGAFALLTKAMNKLDVKPKDTALAMANVGIVLSSMSIIVTALGALMSVPHFSDFAGKGIDTVQNMMSAIIPLVTAGGAFFLLTKGFTALNINAKDTLKAMLNLGIVVGGLTALLAILGVASLIPFDPERLNALVNLLGVLGAVGVALTVASNIIGAMPVDKILQGIGTMTLALGSMIGLLTLLGLVSMIPFDVGRVAQLVGVITALGLIGTALVFMGRLVGEAPVAKVAKGLANMAIMLVGLTAVFVLISAIPDNLVDTAKVTRVAGAIALLGVVGTALAMLGTIAGVLPTATVALGLANMAIMIAGLTALLVAISAIPDNLLDTGKMYSVAKAITVLGLVGTALSVLGGISGLIPTALVALGLANMAIMIAGLTALLVAISAIPSGLVNPERTIAVSKAILVLGLVGSALSVLGGIVGLIPVPLVLLGLVNMAIMIAGLTALLVAISALPESLVNTDRAIAVAKAIGVLGAVGSALSVLAGVVGLIPVPVILSGLADIALVIGGMTAIIAAFGALSQIDGFDDFISRGGSSLANLFNQIGKIGGSLIGGFGEGMANSLPAIGKKLAEFGEAIKPLFDALGGVNTSGVGDAFKALGVFMLEMTASNFMDNIAGFIGGKTDLVSYANGLREFGEAIKPFFENISNVPDGGLEKAPKVFEALGGIKEHIEKVGGLVQAFTGQTDLSSLGQQMSDFIEPMSGFFNAVSNIPDDGLSKAPSVFEALGGIQEHIEKVGGVAQWFTGSTDLVNLGGQLVSFILPMLLFFGAVSTINEDGLTKAPRVFEALGGIQEHIEKVGGVAQWWSGTTNLTDLGQQLSDFMTPMKKFFLAASTIPEAGLTKAPKVFEALGEIGNTIPKSGGITELWSGSVDLSGFAQQLSSFATTIKPFFTTINSVNIGKTNAFVQALQNVIFLSAMSFMSGLSISSLGTELKKFAEESKSFFDYVNTVDLSSMSTFASSLQEFFSVISTIVSTDISSISTSLAELPTQITAISSSFAILGASFALFSQTIKTSLSDLETLKSTANGEINLTITDNASEVISTVQTNLMTLTAQTNTVELSANDNATGTIEAVIGTIASIPSDHNTDMNATDINVTSMCADLTSKILSVPSSHTTRFIASDGVTSTINNIKNALNNMPTSKTITLNVKQNGSIPQNASGTDYFEGGMTWINEKGGELVDLPRGTTIIPHDKSITEALSRGMNLGAKALGGYITSELNTRPVVPATTAVNQSAAIRELARSVSRADNTSAQSNNDGGNAYDYSITFAPGSIVIQAPANSSENDMKQMAEYIIKYAERRQQKQAMARKV